MVQGAVQKAAGHVVEIEDRKNIKMTGVVDVDNFSETSVDIRTVNGTIILKGSGFNVSKLDTELGELCICGEVTSLQYTKTKQRRAVLEGLFK